MLSVREEIVLNMESGSHVECGSRGLVEWNREIVLNVEGGGHVECVLKGWRPC